MWTAWRQESPSGQVLCASAVGAVDCVDPTPMECIHFGTLGAIAADHSCSPGDLREVIGTTWLRRILLEARKTGRRLLGAIASEERIDIWINSHVQSRRVPARFGLAMRTRLPFWIVLGDLILGAVVLPFSYRLYEEMMIVAANGGLLGLERVNLTSIGSFQLVLGREVGLNAYGQLSRPYMFSKFDGVRDNARYYELSEFVSWELDLPILEYRPMRMFAAALTTSFIAQLGMTIDFPVNVERVRDSTPDFSPAWTFYARLGFEARRYFE